MNESRVKRSRSDLLQELGDQIALLVNACESFDRGLEAIGKHIALSLRVLLHHHRNSQALLQQLDMRSKRFMDSAGILSESNMLTDCPLCAMRIGSNEAYLPLCAVGGGPMGTRWIPFEEWWNNSVVKDNMNRRFNRRDLILHVADTDGGAHVDPALDAAYADFSRNNSLGWTINVRNDVQRPFPPPTLACIRQIAHELLKTLQEKYPGVVTVAYAA